MREGGGRVSIIGKGDEGRGTRQSEGDGVRETERERET